MYAQLPRLIRGRWIGFLAGAEIDLGCNESVAMRDFQRLKRGIEARHARRIKATNGEPGTVACAGLMLLGNQRLVRKKARHGS